MEAKADEEEGERKDESESDEGEIPPPGEGLSEEVFEIEKILTHMHDGKQKLYFCVRWKGFGEEDDSWEPADNLQSAGAVIQAYWDSLKETKNKEKTSKKTAKKRSPIQASSSSPIKKPRPSREQRQQTKTTRSTKSRTPRSPEESESEISEISASEDETFGESSRKNKKSKVLSKGALKSFETPKKAAPNRTKKAKTPPLSNARKAAIDNRKSWLYDDSSDSNDEQPREVVESNKNQPKKESTPPPILERVDEVVEANEFMDETPAELMAEEPTGEPIEEKFEVNEAKEPSKKKHKKSKKEKKKSKKDHHHEEEVPLEQNLIEPAPSSSTSDPKVPRLKIKLTPPEQQIFASSSSDCKTLNLKKYKPLADVPDLKEIEAIEGVVLTTQSKWEVMVRDIAGVAVVMSAEEAFDRCGWTLVQFLLSRSVFQNSQAVIL